MSKDKLSWETWAMKYKFSMAWMFVYFTLMDFGDEWNVFSCLMSTWEIMRCIIFVEYISEWLFDEAAIWKSLCSNCWSQFTAFLLMQNKSWYGVESRVFCTCCSLRMPTFACFLLMFLLPFPIVLLVKNLIKLLAVRIGLYIPCHSFNEAPLLQVSLWICPEQANSTDFQSNPHNFVCSSWFLPVIISFVRLYSLALLIPFWASVPFGIVYCGNLWRWAELRMTYQGMSGIEEEHGMLVAFFDKIPHYPKAPSKCLHFMTWSPSVDHIFYLLFNRLSFTFSVLMLCIYAITHGLIFLILSEF